MVCAVQYKTRCKQRSTNTHCHCLSVRLNCTSGHLWIDLLFKDSNFLLQVLAAVHIDFIEVILILPEKHLSQMNWDILCVGCVISSLLNAIAWLSLGGSVIL